MRKIILSLLVLLTLSSSAWADFFWNTPPPAYVNSGQQYTITVTATFQAQNVNLLLNKNGATVKTANGSNPTISPISVPVTYTTSDTATGSDSTVDYTAVARIFPAQSGITEFTSSGTTRVIATNAAPTVTWTVQPAASPNNPIIGQAFQLRAQGTDSDGNLSLVEIVGPGGQVLDLVGGGTGYTSDTNLISYNPTANGVLTFTASAYDGKVTTSNSIQVKIGRDNVLPIVYWNQGPTTGYVGDVLTFQPGSSDQDGSVSQVNVWRDLHDGQGAQLVSTAVGQAVSFTPTVAGTITYTAEAIDNLGGSSGVISRDVTVRALPSPAASFDWKTITGSVDPGIPTATAAAGVVGGNVSVDAHGSANYAIPLKIPPGRAGLEPSLALSYSSGSGNGPLGVGWNLSTGFPQAITRGRTIAARDEAVRGVNFDGNDKYYLDGKRLICVSGTEGQPGSSYRTEVDSFVTIQASGTGTTIDTFVVTDKSGRKFTFGKYNSSNDGYQMGSQSGETLAYAYALKHVEDTVNNTVDLSYLEVVNSASVRLGEYVLSSIDYTGNATHGIAAYNHVTFQYNTQSVGGDKERTDRTISYISNRMFAHSRRLDSINVVAGTQRAAYYTLTYGYGDNPKRTRLTGVTPYLYNTSSSSFNFFPATTVTWSDTTVNAGAISKYYLTTGSSTLPSAPMIWGYQPFAFGDFDGDGKEDYVDARNGLLVYLGGASGFAAAADWTPAGGVPANFNYASKDSCGSVYVADVNGDGKKDLILANAYFKEIYAVISTGQGFSAPVLICNTDTILKDPTTDAQAWQLRESEAGGVGDRVTVADYTGDGRDDVLIHGFDGYLYLFKSLGTSFAAVKKSSSPAGPPANVSQEYTWNQIFHSFMPDGFFIEHVWVHGMPVDVNGDGITDYVWRETQRWSAPTTQSYSAVQLLRCAFGTASGDFTSATQIMANTYSNGAPPGSSTQYKDINQDDLLNYTLQGDFNGDGLTDFLMLRSLDIAVKPELRWTLYLNRGGNFAPSSVPVLPDVVLTSQGAVSTIYRPVDPGTWLNRGFTQGPGPVASQLGSAKEFSLAEANAAQNTFAIDVNHDGLTDFVWYAWKNANYTSTDCQGWWVLYSNGTSFGNPTKLTGEPWDSARPTPFELGNATRPMTWYSIGSGADANGDGFSDYIINKGTDYADSSVLVGVSFGSGPFGELVTRVTDGLGQKTDISYKAGKDPALYTRGVASVQYPIREILSSQPVVSDVFRDSGDSASPAQFSYQYSGNYLDLSGRGSLGFHSFITLDRQTKLFKYQFLAQSFPMTGLATREQTYRFWEADSKVNFRLLSSHDNTVVFDEVVNGPGGASFGTVYPFISSAIESRWENSDTAHFTFTKLKAAGTPEPRSEELFPAARPAGAHITISAQSWFDEQPLTAGPQTTLPDVTGYNPSDAITFPGTTTVSGTTTFTLFDKLPRKITYGNLTRLKTDYGDGFTETVTTTYKTPSNGLTGLVDKVSTSVTSPSYGTETAPVKSYTYSGVTPLVATETLDSSDDKLDLKTIYNRDDIGRVTSTEIEGLNTPGDQQFIGKYTTSTLSDYDDRFDLPKKSQNAYAHTTTSVYHPLFGSPISITDPNGVEVATTYDALGRANEVKNIQTSQTNTVEYAYTTAASTGWSARQTVSGPTDVGAISLISAYAVRTTATVQCTSTTYYDRLGRAIRIIKEGFSDLTTYTDTAYDMLGRVVASSLPYPSDGSPLWTKTEYDPLGRVSKITAPNGTITVNTYIGRSTQTTTTPSGGTGQTNTTYVDAKGRTVKVWNADNVPASIDPSSGSTAEASIAYNIDGFGRMRETILKGQTQKISATYDALGRQLSLSDPDKGSWSYLNNALGQVVQQTDAVGNVTKTTFDQLGRALTRTTTEVTGPVETASWFYYDNSTDAALHTVAKGDKGWVGAPQREESSTSGAGGYAASNSATTTVHYYDGFGHPTIDLSTIDGKWFYTYRDYDQFSRLSNVRHYWKPAGHEAANDLAYVWQDFGYSYTYDTKSYLLRLKDSSGRTWWQADSTKGYDYLDRPVFVQKGASYWTKRTYKPEDGTLTGIVTGGISGSAVAGTVQNLSFVYDGLGNLTARSDTLHGLSETFGYDNLNRLTQRNGATIVSYQANGNIDWKYDVADTKSAVYSYDDVHPHAVKSAWDYTMSYDANGNLKNRSKDGELWSTIWTGYDMPRWLAKGQKGSEFVYNSARSRVLRLEFDAISANGPSHYTQKRIYAFGPTIEIDYLNTVGSGAPVWKLDRTRIYIPGPDGQTGTIEFTGRVKPSNTERALVYHYDHLGSIESITDYGDTSLKYSVDGAGLASHYSYESWGQRRNSISWSGVPTTTAHGGKTDLTPRGYTGHEMLDDIGLIHMGGRIYDPLIGRFLSADIHVQAPGNFQSYNRYSYVMNNPLTLVDPTGYSWVDEFVKKLDDAKHILADLFLPDAVKRSHGAYIAPEEQQGFREVYKEAVIEGGHDLEVAAKAVDEINNNVPILGPVKQGMEMVVGKNLAGQDVDRSEKGGQLAAGLVVGSIGERLGPIAARQGSKFFSKVESTLGSGQKGFVSGFSEILKKARGAKAGNVSDLGEIQVAKILRSERKNVHFQKPIGPRGPRTADYLVGGQKGTGVGGVVTDTLTPSTSNPASVYTSVSRKNDQAPSIIVNLLNNPSVRAEQLGSEANILEQVRLLIEPAGGTMRINSVRVIDHQ